ncbi:hypothetical protein Q9Q99_18790 [Curtobacterium flaccumfaciens]|nr:hypothetical protein Q9Q99_18790 [Curtobacterium flaccumfaciens]
MTDTDRLDQARTVPLDDVTPSPDQAQTVPLGESVPPGATKPMPQYPRQHQHDTGDTQGARQSPPASWSATPRVGSGPVGGPGSGRGSGMTAGQFYRDAWRRLPRDFGYMALTAVLLCTLYFAFPAAVFGGGFQ